jgi:mono/diheme cytochrome c family protein
MRNGMACALALLWIVGYVKPGSAGPGPPPPAQRDYLLACGGCHGLLGTTNSKAVPQLKGLVGFYLNTPEGRSYLPRLPNVAFAALSDQDLAAVLNYVVFDLGGASVPAGARPYDTAEVSRWRARPLTEVPLSQYRRRLVATLIEHYHAPATLESYDAHAY